MKINSFTFLNWFSDDINIKSEETIHYILNLFDYIKNFFLLDYVNGCVKLWIPIKKDSKETYEKYCRYHYEGCNFYGEYEEIPDTIWIRALFCSGGDERIIVINKKVFHIDLSDSYYYPNDISFLELFKYLKKKIVFVTKLIKSGKYQNLVEKELPYEYRYGTIFKKELWKINQKYKKINNGKITKKLISEFKNAYKLQKTDNALTNPTFNDYFEMAISFYKKIGYEVDNNKTLFENFVAHGEDFGGNLLANLDHDSDKDFIKYYKELAYTQGGHPWGIIRGSSRSRVTLFPKENERGFFFVLTGNAAYSSYEMIVAYIEFISKGYHVEIGCYEDIINYVTGNEYLGFVPNYVLPVYCSEYFSKKVNDFTWLNDKKLIPYIEWNKIETPILLNDFIQIKFDKDTFNEIVNILDKATRFIIGQFIYAFPDELDKKKKSDISYKITGLPHNESYGIYSDKVHEDAKKSYDLLQTFRYQLFLMDKEKYKNTVYANKILKASKLKDVTADFVNNEFYVKCRARVLDFIVYCLLLVANLEKGNIKEIIVAIDKYFIDKRVSDEELKMLLEGLYTGYNGKTSAYSVLYYIERSL